MSEPVLVTEAASSDRKRIVRLLVIAGVVLVAAFVLPKVLFGGEDTAEEEFDFGSTPTTVAPAAEPAEETVEVVRAFSSRNPFTPLVGPATGGDAGAPAAPGGEAVPVTDPTPPPTDPVIVLPDLDDYFPPTPPPTAPPTTEPPATPPTTAPPPGPARFALGEVFQDGAGQVLARVRINDVVHEVIVGRDFAEHYRFVSADLQNRCASFLYGDNRFELCEGEETLT